MTERSWQNQSASCPYLEITSAQVVCKAVNWGRGLTGVQQYGPLPRSMIMRCSSADHLKCNAYRKARAKEEIEKGIQE